MTPTVAYISPNTYLYTQKIGKINSLKCKLWEKLTVSEYPEGENENGEKSNFSFYFAPFCIVGMF